MVTKEDLLKIQEELKLNVYREQGMLLLLDGLLKKYDQSTEEKK